jgi:hypothetical protein
MRSHQVGFATIENHRIEHRFRSPLSFDAPVDPPRVELVELLLDRGGQAERVDVAAGVVEVVAGGGSMPRTAPIISEPNRMRLVSMTVNSRSMPGWWYTQVSKDTLPMTDSASGGRPSMSARPRKRPQW